jgi:molybdopterin biosynthesis enzyme
VVSVAGTQASHVLSSFAKANGLVDVSPKTTLPAGETVMVRLWEP